MPKARDARADAALVLYRQGKLLKEIAVELGVAEGTVRSWKNRYQWDSERNATLQKSDRNVANKDKTNKNKNKQKEPIASEVDDVIQNTGLTDKQRLFCIYYIRCFNATKAYQKAYECSYTTAIKNGSRMLTNAEVKAEILRLKQERLNREFLSEADIFQKYIDIAFADLTDYTEFGTEEVPVMGAFGPLKAKDPETGQEKPLTKIVNTVRFKPSTDVDGTILTEVKQGKDGASIKLADRMKALQWLSDHMDLATEEQRVRIAIMKAKTESGDAPPEDDGFLDALNATAAEDWADEEDT